MEKFVDSTGHTVLVHHAEACEAPCPVHAPSDHHMTGWPLHWRDDRQIWERICPDHHIGHPDPDQYTFAAMHDIELDGVHGCDGCCQTSAA